ncbi:hypothetical protein FACS1894163_10410 [Spirochaetia bacterium]|nr:hypothetical protein FACS1894163_10410 [Spirochaetia bacterium]
MNKRLSEVLQGKQGNYILPFFWQHGSTEATLREYMEKIHDCGIRAVCVEARPHPDFAGPGWWKDVDVIMDEARKRGMRVWILDDSHFPTGYANGAAVNAPDKLKRWSLVERTMLVDGPTPGCKFEVASHLGYAFADKGQYQFKEYFKEELAAVIAGRRQGDGAEVCYTDFEDITSSVTKEGWIYRDFPEGSHCLFIYTKRQGAAAVQNNYISFLEKDSVRLLIDAVYEPHYQHYKDDFGGTFAGFFSDEPGFYNLSDIMYGLGRIGDNMPLPWTDDVAKQFIERTTGSDLASLPGLFHILDGRERPARYAYMDIITRKYQSNFSDQLGGWCQERHVEYIGHVLEDGLFSQSLGAGTGHYFRALHGQHMGGIDVVINNLLPEQDYGNGFFYHYELPILAASAAHQNDWMQGRAMCEIFGAFGWSEGLTLMKWMADHMLVNGINWFVPHAFSEKAFPDSDNPPHFYAHGNNPQFRHMHKLFNYMNRVCHLINGGRAVVDTAIFFPAEGSWVGRTAPFGRIGSRLIQNQIPYEIICMDNLKQAKVNNDRICIGQAAYRNLFIDNVEYLPADYLEVLQELHRQGAKVWFVDHAPCGFDSNRMTDIPVISDEELLPLLADYHNCKTAVFTKWLRCYQYKHQDLTVYMFANSSMSRIIETDVTIPYEGKRMPEYMLGYDALNEHLFTPEINADGSLHLYLDKGESFLLLAGDKDGFVNDGLAANPGYSRRQVKAGKEMILNGPFDIFTANYDTPDEFVHMASTEKLGDIALKKEHFAGIIRYETTFTGRYQWLSLGRCSEGVEVFVNGCSVGARIAYPYTYDIGDFVEDGDNHLRIEVVTTLTNAIPDGLSMDRAVEPQGIFGPIKIYS